MKRPEKTKCYVYWVHLEGHTDMFSQGYVGMTTKLPKYRLSEHKTIADSGKDLPISRAIRKYGEALRIGTLIVSTQELCYLYENKLRPAPNIGWNIAIGGQISGTTGRKHSDSTLLKISEANLGKRMSIEAKSKISKANLGKKLSEETKAKIAASRLGKKHSEETRAKMSKPRIK